MPVVDSPVAYASIASVFFFFASAGVHLACGLSWFLSLSVLNHSPLPRQPEFCFNAKWHLKLNSWNTVGLYRVSPSALDPPYVCLNSVKLLSTKFHWKVLPQIDAKDQISCWSVWEIRPDALKMTSGPCLYLAVI